MSFPTKTQAVDISGQISSTEMTHQLPRCQVPKKTAKNTSPPPKPNFPQFPSICPDLLLTNASSRRPRELLQIRAHDLPYRQTELVQLLHQRSRCDGGTRHTFCLANRLTDESNSQEINLTIPNKYISTTSHHGLRSYCESYGSDFLCGCSHYYLSACTL